MDFNIYIAKTLSGLEDVLAEELKNIGAKNIIKHQRAVEFRVNKKNLYKANLSLRTCFRILKPLFSFNAQNPDQLYRKIKEFNWNSIITSDDTIVIDPVINSRYFTHSKYAALKVKDAIVDHIRETKGKRPNVDINNPKFRFNIHIEQNHCSILLDSSGESLHKRGYRIHSVKAPLNEVLAAGMIYLSEWDANSNFVDTMCGSGTLVIEAALLAKNISPNINRQYFGFMKWKDFDKNLFNKVKAEIIQNEKKFYNKILANDISKKAIEIAKENSKIARVFNDIEFLNYDFRNLKHNLKYGTIITNPPYNERIKLDDIKKLYKEFGDTLKNNFNGFDVWVLSANSDALKSIGLRTSKRLHLLNGALESRFYKYQIYTGSKKKKYEKI